MSKKPLIAIVGRPNVGKSALFNRLARKRIALVEDFAGTTRDRLYADCDLWGRDCTVIDTGGLDPADTEGYMPAVAEQAHFAIEEADVIVFLTDGRQEPTTLDYEIADILRRTKKPVILAANKMDNIRMEPSNLFALRIGTPVKMSAVSGVGVAELTEEIAEVLAPLAPDDEPEEVAEATRIAIVGRPNVGKSAFTNRVLGYERSIVSAEPGTTRDAIDTTLQWKGKPVMLIDTAGMRRKARVRAEKSSHEYHMVLRSLRAVDRSTVTILMLEAGGVTEQDTKIAGYSHEEGNACIIAVNKWDIIEPKWQAGKYTAAQKDYLNEVARYLPFISYAPVHFTSAINGTNVPATLDDALSIAPNVEMRVGTGELNTIVRRAMADHPPPGIKGRPVKIRYVTQAEVAPPKIIIFCNQPDALHFSYVRYLENKIRAAYPFRGVPLKIELRASSGEREKD